MALRHASKRATLPRTKRTRSLYGGLALFLLVLLQCSCTTLVNRRDLYSPEPAPDSLEEMKQMTTVTTTTTSMRREEIAPAGY